MANYPIYRLNKGTTLTFTEMDGNLEWLSRNMSASVVTITGSTSLLGNLNVSRGITASLQGTSSWAVSASWAPSSNSPAATATYYIATGSVTASVNTDISASLRVISGSNTLLNLTRDGQLWLGNGSFINAGYQLDIVGGNARINGLPIGIGNSNSTTNTAFGLNAMYLATVTGLSNTAVGRNALRYITSGEYNTAIGDGTMANDTVGTRNTVVGAGSGNVQGGGNNTVVGAFAGTGIAGGSGNIFLGYTAGYVLGGVSNVLSINSKTLAAVDEPNGAIIYGVQSTNLTNQILRLNARTGVGLSADPVASAQLQIDSTSSGFLPTRTDLTSNISNPAQGLLTYITSSLTEGLYYYLSGSIKGWTRLLNSTGSQSISGSLTVLGTITAQTIVAQTITSSTEWITGSSKFGSLVTDTHQFTGSLLANNITGSLFGTSSWSIKPISSIGSNIYSTSPLAAIPIPSSNQNNIFLGDSAGVSGNNVVESNFIGYLAGNGVSASYANFIGSFAGSSATNANNSNFIGSGAGSSATTAADSVFIGTNSGNAAGAAELSIFIGSGAGSNATSASYSNFIGQLAGGSATNASFSVFIGNSAGYFSKNAEYSNFIGSGAGSYTGKAFNSTFIGVNAGSGATSSSYSNFIGEQVALSATFADHSNFIGYRTGYYATSASYSNFIGSEAGYYSPSASYCILIGYRAGSPFNGFGVSSTKSIGPNNIIIGNGITLPVGAKDSINIGGIIFGTGSYFVPNNTDPNGNYPLSGSANGRIGINIPSPTQALDVSGSVQISELLVLPPRQTLPSIAPTGSIASSGSGVNCKPYFWNGATWTALF